MADIDQEFVEFVVKALVNDPDQVKIERSIDEKGVLLQLTVGQEDLGRVIGKRGNTAQSIRTLLRALGTKNDARYNLKIVDPEGGERPPRPERTERHDDFAPAASAAAPAAAVASADEPIASADPATTEPASSGASQWAHLSSNDEPSDDDSAAPSTDDNDENDDEENSSNSVVEKTREELADLDGLDI